MTRTSVASELSSTKTGVDEESSFGSPTLVARNNDGVSSIPSLSWTVIPASSKSLRTHNPIRAIVDPIAALLQKPRTDGKSPISLALGDPTVYDNLHPCPIGIEAIAATLTTTASAAGYANACGTSAARQAVAAFHGAASVEDVILANGCSGALEIALTALLDTNSILLVPQPGFPLYQVIAESHGASVVHYRLDTDDWSVDVEHVRSLLMEHGSSVAAIVINNPSNPTGAVYTEEQLRSICSVCQEFHLPIVADEIYGDLVFGTKQPFVPIASIATPEYQVPVITASGIGKQFLLPGWRVGWIVCSDNSFGALQHVWDGAQRLAQVVLGASHLTQTAVPALLALDDPRMIAWKQDLRLQLQRQAGALSAILRTAPGLHVVDAKGAMYALVKIDTIQLGLSDDVTFADRLLQEEAVFVLPGSCFGIPNAFRVVFCASVPVLEEAADRICRFCKRHTA